MDKRTFPAVDKLAREAEQAAADTPDTLAELVCSIRAVIDTDPELYALVGALAEGIAVTITTRISEQKREATAAAALRLLYDRLRAGWGAVDRLPPYRLGVTRSMPSRIACTSRSICDCGTSCSASSSGRAPTWGLVPAVPITATCC